MKNHLLNSLKGVILQPRSQLSNRVNADVAATNRNVGNWNFVDESTAPKVTEYGRGKLKSLAQSLNMEFGNGFDENKLDDVRYYHDNFPSRDGASLDLGRAHDLQLSRTGSKAQKSGCEKDCITKNWTYRAMRRQIVFSLPNHLH